MRGGEIEFKRDENVTAELRRRAEGQDYKGEGQKSGTVKGRFVIQRAGKSKPWGPQGGGETDCTNEGRAVDGVNGGVVAKGGGESIVQSQAVE